jgi:FkbM family methyltransferase
MKSLEANTKPSPYKVRPIFLAFVIFILLLLLLFFKNYHGSYAQLFFENNKMHVLQRLKRKDFKFTIDYFGLQYTGSTSKFIDRMVLLYGSYEPYILAFMKDTIESRNLLNKAVILDVGAYHGTHTLFLSKFSKTVHAFEPAPEPLRFLQNNVESNKLSNVTIHPVGLGNKNAIMDLYDTKNSGSPVASFIENSWDESKSIGKFNIVNGDQYLNYNKISNISLIKIDVEGYEKSVLQGLVKTIKKDKPVIYVEIRKGIKDHSFTSVKQILELMPKNYIIKQLKQKKEIENNNYDYYDLVDIKSWRKLPTFSHLILLPSPILN